jgi:hypothetical protein
MLKLRKGPLIILGLSKINLERLQKDQPIQIMGEELEIPGVRFVICYGETEHDIVQDLNKHGANITLDDKGIPIPIQGGRMKN